MSHKLIANATRSPDGTFAARVIRAHDRAIVMFAPGYPNAYAALDSARAHIDALDNPAPVEAPTVSPVTRAIKAFAWVRDFVRGYLETAPLTAPAFARGVDLLYSALDTVKALKDREEHGAHYAAMLDSVTDDASPTLNAYLT